MTIEFLRVLNGDSILIRFTDKDNNKRNILIDGGPTNSYTYSDRRTKRPCAGDLKLRLEEIKKQQEKIDLLVVTHIDDDHIGGILKWMEDASFSKENIGKIWFNSGQLIFDFFKEPLPPENLILLKRNLDLNTSIPQGVTFEKVYRFTRPRLNFSFGPHSQRKEATC